MDDPNFVGNQVRIVGLVGRSKEIAAIETVDFASLSNIYLIAGYQLGYDAAVKLWGIDITQRPKQLGANDVE
jgi:hypothetical protein